ncbi:hypothetical protein NEDG_02152 [Nematocida displodere]|uniref:E3 ubiquitin protein ligase n=1 Tax=Nematocida displodere TaxID=1805483 RepID=A0A177EFW8_9MICR|nr:hypothetical protein NEDG_02152 [Nematocida displodere]
MDKRRAEVTPLKKTCYNVSQEESESNWWDNDSASMILKKKIESVYAQMEEYKLRAKELEEEKARLLETKIPEMATTEEAVATFQNILLKCNEHTLLISQLRKRLAAQKEHPPGPPPQSPRTAAETQPEAPNTAKEIEEYIAKIGVLESKIELFLSKHPPNYTTLVKTLELESKELTSTNTALAHKVAEELQKNHDLSNALAAAESTLQTYQMLVDTLRSDMSQAAEEEASQKSQLIEKTDELYLVIERINGNIADYSREVEKENFEDTSCIGECRLKLKELEDKEMDRVEEVSFLVRKYIDTAKINDDLRQKIEQMKKDPMIKVVKEINKENEAKLSEECTRLRLDLEKSRLDYLERKSSSQYHKRKSVQYESELKALAKTVADLEKTNQGLHTKLQAATKPAAPDASTKEIELYRKMVRCAVCSTNMKDAILKKCMHLLCRECINGRYATRQRTCPLCGIVFSMSDVSHVFL